jgi:hypothetical protein
MTVSSRVRALFALFSMAILFGPQPGVAAEATTGAIYGAVVDQKGGPLASVAISAASPSGVYSATTDARGRFSILGVVPDQYTVSAELKGFVSVETSGLRVLPGEREEATFTLAPELRTVGHVVAGSSAFVPGSTSDTFTVSGAAARAVSPPVSSAGLATYISGTVQGSIASVPGVVLDQFANAILRGGKVSDAAFDYDSVPIPQGLVAEPGGNIVGAQLPTTGIASTTVTLAGYTSQGANSLGGVIDQIPAVGTFPGSTTFEVGDGLAGGQYQNDSLLVLGATPDKKLRYALASTVGAQYFSYGDGKTFYPAEAATYGLALQSRGEYSLESNLHYQLTSKDDVSVLGLVGQAAYNQYGSPYAGETVGAFDGQSTTYPGETNPNAPEDFASGIRGSYSILKLAWLHSGDHSLSRLQLYQSQYGSSAGGPFWDENGWPDGSISLAESQGSREEGLGYDGQEFFGGRHDVRFGAEYRTNTSFLDQIVPTADEFITSRPTLISYLAYLGDTWNITPRLELSGTARWTQTHIIPSDGPIYDVGALDPHGAIAYKLGGGLALRATYDRITVAPLPLEADRTDSTNVDANGNLAPFVALAPETANDFTYSLEGGGRTQFRATYYLENEANLIDVLPYNFRSALASGLNPNGVGVPSNIGNLHAYGYEFWLKRDGFTLDANYVNASSSSASQFAYNDLNAPAVAAGQLFPVSYLPNFTANLAYEFDTPNKKVRITPSLSYESGYPYGNGKEIWIFDPTTNKPEEVPNDNYWNPGYNYYFLANPAEPYNAKTNPYIGNLGTPEGNDPNTLRAPGETFANLHVEGDLSPRLTAILDVTNLLGNASPTAYQGNPYLIGPPGYAGGNLNYENAYASAGGYATGPPTGVDPCGYTKKVPNPCYTLGNGVPTNTGYTQAVPWTYGRGGYIPQNFPAARSIQFRLRYRL